MRQLHRGRRTGAAKGQRLEKRGGRKGRAAGYGDTGDAAGYSESRRFRGVCGDASERNNPDQNSEALVAHRTPGWYCCKQLYVLVELTPGTFHDAGWCVEAVELAPLLETCSKSPEDIIVLALVCPLFSVEVQQ